MSTSARADVLIDVETAQLSWEPLHQGLEELDRAGFTPHRLSAISDRMLARVDRDLVGSTGALLQRASGWIIERKSEHAASFVCGEAQTAEVSPELADPITSAISGAFKTVVAALTPDDSQSPSEIAEPDDDMPIMGVAAFTTDPHSYAARTFGRRTVDVVPVELGEALAPHRITITHGILYSIRERGYQRALFRNIALGAVPYLHEHFGAAVSVVPPVPRKRPRALVLASGSGSNFQAVIDAVASGAPALDICGVIVNRVHAGARDRAERANIPAVELPWQRQTQTRAAYDAELLAAAEAFAPDVVLLLGWMHLLPATFVDAFPEMLNVHPAYLPLDPADDTVVLPDGTMQPAFRGADAVGDARRARARWIGASVHRVTSAMDRGEIFARVPIAFDPADDPAETAERLHRYEHRILLAALRSRIEYA